MAVYLSPTVVQQAIPVEDMTPLECLVLSSIFNAEPEGDALYFYSSTSPNDRIEFSTSELHAAIDASAGTDSSVSTYVRKRVPYLSAKQTEIEIDFRGASWEIFFQDIIRRSPTLQYITVVTSFTCSEMRPDGFGGMAVLITSDAIVGRSTKDILHDLLGQADLLE